MDIEKAKVDLSEWAKSKPFITKLYICGSWGRGNHRHDSDIDIVLEVDPYLPDVTAFSTYLSRRKDLKRELEELLNWKLHMMRYDSDDPEFTPIARDCLQKGNILVFSRTG